MIKRNEVISIRDSSLGKYSSNHYHRHGSIVLLFRGQRQVRHIGEELNYAQLESVAERDEDENEKKRERDAFINTNVRRSNGKNNEYK